MAIECRCARRSWLRPQRPDLPAQFVALLKAARSSRGKNQGALKNKSRVRQSIRRAFAPCSARPRNRTKERVLVTLAIAKPVEIQPEPFRLGVVGPAARWKADAVSRRGPSNRGTSISNETMKMPANLAARSNHRVLGSRDGACSAGPSLRPRERLGRRRVGAPRATRQTFRASISLQQNAE